MIFGQSQSSTNSTNFELSQSLTQRFGNLEINDPSQVNRFQNPATQINQYGDDRPINAKGTYEIPDSEIQFEEDLAEKEVAKEDSGLMAKVMAGFESFLQKKITKKFKDDEESKESIPNAQTGFINMKKDELRK